jgi:hypothetical protein
LRRASPTAIKSDGRVGALDHPVLRLPDKNGYADCGRAGVALETK